MVRFGLQVRNKAITKHGVESERRSGDNCCEVKGILSFGVALLVSCAEVRDAFYKSKGNSHVFTAKSHSVHLHLEDVGPGILLRALALDENGIRDIVARFSVRNDRLTRGDNSLVRFRPTRSNGFCWSVWSLCSPCSRWYALRYWFHHLVAIRCQRVLFAAVCSAASAKTGQGIMISASRTVSLGIWAFSGSIPSEVRLSAVSASRRSFRVWLFTVADSSRKPVRDCDSIFWCEL